MTRQFIARQWMFSPQARSPGITWIPTYKSIRRHRPCDLAAFLCTVMRGTRIERGEIRDAEWEVVTANVASATVRRADERSVIRHCRIGPV